MIHKMAYYQKQKYVSDFNGYLNDENDKEIKQNIVNYIYYNDNFDLSKYRFKIIESNNDMDILRKQLHFISPNYDGMPCLFVIFNKDEMNYVYMINRKSLVYNISQVVPQNIVMYPMSINVNNLLFDGTIFDGIYISSSNTYIITDVYLLCGKNMSNIIITDKLLNISSYIKKIHSSDSNSVKFQINKLYDMKNIIELLKKMKFDEQKCNSSNLEHNQIKKYENTEKYTHHVTNDKTNNNIYSSKGIVFYPSKSGTKIIYIFSIKNENIENAELCYEKSKSNKTIDDKKKSKYYNLKKKTVYKTSVSYQICFVFDMIKTEIPDVYKLFLTNNKKEHIFIDIAYIPTLELSKKFMLEFKNIESQFVNCKFDREKNKWIPIDCVLSCNYPQNIDDCREIIDIYFV